MPRRWLTRLNFLLQPKGVDTSTYIFYQSISSGLLRARPRKQSRLRTRCCKNSVGNFSHPQGIARENETVRTISWAWEKLPGFFKHRILLALTCAGKATSIRCCKKPGNFSNTHEVVRTVSFSPSTPWAEELLEFCNHRLLVALSYHKERLPDYRCGWEMHNILRLQEVLQ